MPLKSTFPALRRRVGYLENRMNESRKGGRQPLSFDVAEYAELNEALRRLERRPGGHRSDRRLDEPPRLPDRDRQPEFEDTFVPGEPRGTRFYGGRPL